MDKEIKILIVEDDNDINKILSKLVERNGYISVQAYSGTEAMMYIKSMEFDMVLIDLMLPGISGEELLRNIRKIKQMPIIVISAKIDKQVKIDMLKSGADDYITKPFDIDEVSARIYSNLRRCMKFSTSTASENIIKCKDISLNVETKEVFVNNNKVILTAREFEILKLLMEHPKKVFTKENLFESVWGTEYLGDDNTVNVHMSNLRSKLLKANPDNEYIETIWGMGYKING